MSYSENGVSHQYGLIFDRAIFRAIPMEVWGKSDDGTINCIPNLQNGQCSIKLRYFEKMEHYSAGRVYQKVRGKKGQKKKKSCKS